jgi:hypothetical protein
MKYLFTLLLFILISGSSFAQNRFGNTNGVSLSQMENVPFLQFDENPSKLFWAINLKDLTGPQKSTFQELVFKNDLLVACSKPDVNNIWYLSSLKIYPLADVTLELNKLIEKAKTLSTNPADKY